MISLPGGGTRASDAPGNPVNNSDNIYILHSVTIGDVLVNNGAKIEIVAPNGKLIGNPGAQLDLKGSASIVIEPGTSITFENTGTVSNPTGSTSNTTLTETNLNNPLPVSWLYFKGKASEKGHELNWATASEKNSLAFEVERSVNGKYFEAIGKVKAAGNSNQTFTYNFTDKQPLTAATAYYRLKQTDNDGAFEYSSIIAIAQNEKVSKVASAYPNPFAKTLNLQLAPDHKVSRVVLMALDGKEVYSKNITTSTDVVLNDLPNLKAGFYLLQLIGENETTTLKVMRQ